MSQGADPLVGEQLDHDQCGSLPSTMCTAGTPSRIARKTARALTRHAPLDAAGVADFGF